MKTIRPGATTLKGEPVDLVGKELRVGETAPDFALQAADMSTVRLSTFSGKSLIVATVPSLDTPVCSKETKHFSNSIAGLPNAEMLVVSMDLPFAQRRWCALENVSNVRCLSDHQTAEFGTNYGVLIHGGPLGRCFSRAIFVIGPDAKLRHVEYVKEIASEPNYDAALAAARS